MVSHRILNHLNLQLFDEDDHENATNTSQREKTIKLSIFQRDIKDYLKQNSLNLTDLVSAKDTSNPRSKFFISDINCECVYTGNVVSRNKKKVAFIFNIDHYKKKIPQLPCYYYEKNTQSFYMTVSFYNFA